MKTGDHKGAVRSYEKLLILNPANFDTYYKLIDAKMGKDTMAS